MGDDDVLLGHSVVAVFALCGVEVRVVSAAETIAAAIQKLEALRNDATAHLEQANDDLATVVFPGTQEWRAEFLRDEDAELAVTLHRTIDAQLAILRETLTFEDGFGIGEDDTTHDLARAILGGAS